jgi:hypothetical protein
MSKNLEVKIQKTRELRVISRPGSAAFLHLDGAGAACTIMEEI